MQLGTLTRQSVSSETKINVSIQMQSTNPAGQPLMAACHSLCLTCLCICIDGVSWFFFLFFRLGKDLLTGLVSCAADSMEFKDGGIIKDKSGKGNDLDLLVPPKREDVLISSNDVSFLAVH